MAALAAPVVADPGMGESDGGDVAADEAGDDATVGGGGGGGGVGLLTEVSAVGLGAEVELSGQPVNHGATIARTATWKYRRMMASTNGMRTGLSVAAQVMLQHNNPPGN